MRVPEMKLKCTDAHPSLQTYKRIIGLWGGGKGVDESIYTVGHPGDISSATEALR